MKKIFIPIIVIVLVLMFPIVAFFTPKGTESLVKPLLNQELEKRVKKPKIVLTKLENSYDKIALEALIQNSITLNVVGSIYYFKKSFALMYSLKANEVEFDGERYRLNMDIKGKAQGTFTKFNVDGAGKAFDSDINYKFIVQRDIIKSIVANISNAKIEQILLLAKQAPYLKGLLHLHVNMPSLDFNNPSGNAKIEVEKGIFNRKLFLKKYNLLLPKDEKLSLLFNAKVVGKKILSTGDINTTTVKLKVKKLISSLDFSIAKLYFSTYIEDLSRLNSLVKQKLKGSLALDGIAYFNKKKNIKQALLTTKSFDGEVKATYSNNKAKLLLKDVSLAKIEHKLSLPTYLTQGKINAKVNVKNLESYESDFTFKSNFTLNQKLFKVVLPSYKYRLKSSGKFENLALLSQTNLDSSYMTLTLKETKYSLLNKRLKSKFNLTIFDLKSLEKLTKAPLRGKLNLYGSLTLLSKDITLNAFTKSFSGLLSLQYNKDRLKVKLKELSLKKILYILNQATLIKSGTISGFINLDSIKAKRGKVVLESKALINNDILEKVYNISFGKDINLYAKTKNTILEKNRLKGDISLKTKGAIFNLYDYVYNIKSSSLKSKYALDFKDLSILNKPLKQKLKGTLKVVGELSKSGKYIFLSGNALKFDGTINFLLKGNKFTLNAAGLSIVKIADMFSQPRKFDGVAKVDLNYNLSSKKGKFNIIIDNARFLNSQLVDTLKRYLNFDVSQELFHKVLIDGNINDNIVIFNLATKSRKVKINIYQGKIDIKAKTIYAKVRVHFNGNDYNFIVKGPLDDPHFKISYSGVLKKKVEKKLKKELEKLGVDKELKKILPKDVKEIEKAIPQDIKESAKELFKGLFK